jgi:DNA-directed RNA polymerase subunit M/transcription elongation factor TFIIS
MVHATLIQPTGSLTEQNVPNKTLDVLEWIRTKTKQPNIQFQGKIQDKDTWVTIFAESGTGEEDNINQHVLGGNFQEEIFVGAIVVMATHASNTDNYEKSATSYINLKPSEYETVYANWTFEGESSDEEDEEVEGIDDADADDPEDIQVGAEEEEAEPEDEIVPTKQRVVKAKQAIVHDVNTPCPLRELVIRRYIEIGLTPEIADRLEKALLQRSIRECSRQDIEVSWNNAGFWNHYRGRCIQFYENAKQGWVPRLLSDETTPEHFAELSVIDLNPKRWKARVEAQIEKDKHLYTHSGSASIYFYCSGCKRKSKCDYYQMQTRSADEPMTTFVTCLECDRRWKF